MAQRRLIDAGQIVQCFPVENLAGTGSDRTGIWIDISLFEGILFLVSADATTSTTQNLTVSVHTRATTGSGTGFAVDWYRREAGNIENTSAWIHSHGTSRVLIGNRENLLITDILATELPTDHHQIRIQSTDPGTTAKWGVATAVCYGSRYPSAFGNQKDLF